MITITRMPRLATTPPATDEAMITTLLEAMVSVGNGDSTGVEEGRWEAVGSGDSAGAGEGFSQVFKLILSSGSTGSRSN